MKRIKLTSGLGNIGLGNFVSRVLAAELSLERRSRLTLDLTNLVRGKAVGRLGGQSVVRSGPFDE